MKISILLKREPFGEIFESTVSRFLSSYSNNNTTIIWSNTQKLPGYQIWICNGLINSIFIKNVNNYVFESIKSEYSKNPLHPWKSIIQKMYFWAATKSFTSVLLAKNYVNIKPAIKGAEDLLFLGGNTKIRLLDKKNNLVYVILKDSYDKKYFFNELSIRESHQFTSAPKIISINKNECWYSEEYIVGVPIDRLKLINKKKIIISAIEVLHILYGNTIVKKKSDEYLSSIITSIHNRIKNINQNQQQEYNILSDSVEMLREKLTKSLPPFISICQNHGDLQFGNIIWDQKIEKLQIMDWEFTKQRQYGYDMFVLCMSIRSRQGGKNIIDAINHGFDKRYSFYLDQFLFLDNKYLNSIFALFLLEEFDFRLEEMEIAVYKEHYGGINGFSDYFKRIEKKL